MIRTVLITGCSSGIGLAAADRFAAAGWNVVATMRTPNADSNGNRLVVPLDVTDPAGIDRAIAAGIDRFGRIDTVVNNAGYGQFGVFEAIPDAQIRAQFDVNLFGVMAMIRAILPHFRARRAGTIVNVSSGAGLFTLPLISAYAASKFALEGFSEALSYELGALGLAVKLVIPHGGVTETRFGERQAAAAPDAGLADYAPYVERVTQAFAGMVAAHSMGAADVAEVVFQAATDGSDRLRYLVGDDARGFVRARRTLAEDDYVAFMRRQFPAR